MSDIKYRNTFEHDSFLGFLNAFKVKDTNWILKPGQRPPYPIIIADPTISQVKLVLSIQVVSNLNKADFGLFLTVSAIGFFASRASMGNLYSTEYLRRRGFSIAWNSFMMMGGLLALMNSNNRLTVSYSLLFRDLLIMDYNGEEEKLLFRNMISQKIGKKDQFGVSSD